VWGNKSSQGNNVMCSSGEPGKPVWVGIKEGRHQMGLVGAMGNNGGKGVLAGGVGQCMCGRGGARGRVSACVGSLYGMAGKGLVPREAE